MNPASPDDIPSRTIMLIDDDTRFTGQLRRYLTRCRGISVIDTACSAEEALLRVGEHLPDFILLDVCLRGMTGLEAIAPLKAASPASSIIMVSSMPAEYGIRAVELGATAYVEKGRIVEDLPPLLHS